MIQWAFNKYCIFLTKFWCVVEHFSSGSVEQRDAVHWRGKIQFRRMLFFPYTYSIAILFNFFPLIHHFSCIPKRVGFLPPITLSLSLSLFPFLRSPPTPSLSTADAPPPSTSHFFLCCSPLSVLTHHNQND